MATATPRVGRHAYEARTTRVMCVRRGEWRATMAEATDDEARAVCAIVALEDLAPGDWVRGLDDDAQDDERWAQVAAVAFGDHPEDLIEYKARFFEDDDDEFLLGGFAAAASGAILASAPPPRYQRETRFEALPTLVGKVQAVFYREDENRTCTRSLGWHAAALSTSNGQMQRRLQHAVDAIERGRYRVDRVKRRFSIVPRDQRNGDAAMAWPHLGYESSHRVGELLFSDAARVGITTRAVCERRLAEAIVRQHGAVRDVIQTAENLVQLELEGQARLVDNLNFRGALNIVEPRILNFGVPVGAPAQSEPFQVDPFELANPDDALIAENWNEEFVADPTAWWAVGFWLGDGSIGRTAFTVGVDPDLDADDDIRTLAMAVNAGRFRDAVYGATEFTSVMSVFATWIERGYADRIVVSERRVVAGEEPGQVRNCVTVRPISPGFRALLRDLGLFTVKTITRETALRMRSLPDECKVNVLAGMIDADGCRALRDIDSVVLTQSFAPIDGSVRPNATLGHDTILTTSCLLAASSRIDARMSLTRKFSNIPGEELRRWESVGHVAFASAHRVIPTVVPSKRVVRSRQEPIFSHVGASFGSWRQTERRAVTAEITLEGASRMVLANGTVAAVKRVDDR